MKILDSLWGFFALFYFLRNGVAVLALLNPTSDFEKKKYALHRRPKRLSFDEERRCFPAKLIGVHYFQGF